MTTSATQVAPASTPAKQTPAKQAPAKQTPAKQRRGTTPTQLTLWRFVTVAVCVVTALAAAALLISARGSMNHAAGATQQLMRMHEIRALLLQADADATASVLTGGDAATDGEPVEEASRLIVEAAQAQPDDPERVRQLQDLNTAVLRYHAKVGLAQAVPEDDPAAESVRLDEAGTHLRTVALPILDDLIADYTTGIEGHARIISPWLVALLQMVPLVVTGYVMVWVARRFHRVLNIGIVAALLALAVGMVVSTSATSSTVNDVRTVTDEHLSNAVAVADARSHAYDARAYENLALIDPARAGDHQASWQAAALAVNDALQGASTRDGSLEVLWRTIEVNHRKSQGMDPDAAKARATSDDVMSDFTAFTDAAAEEMEQDTTASVTKLQSLAPRLVAAGWATLVLGVAAAALAAWGISVRLREYR